MKLYLKIGGEFRLMKMDAASEIALNFTHDNLENPTNYVSEYSYNLKLPCCPENNKLFSNFLHVDSMIVSGGYTPTISMEYMACDDAGSLISSGTAYIKTISGGYYNLSLTGSLSRIFNKLLNSGWDDNNTDLEYTRLKDWLSVTKIGAMFLDDTVNVINKNVVFTSWMVDNPIFDFDTMGATNLAQYYGLLNTYETLCWIANIVGFAPTSQGKLKAFNNDKWVEGGTVGGVPSNAFSLLPVFCSVRNSDNEPVTTVDVEDGAVEGQMCEYRSYYQQPYIYIFRLWQLYQREFGLITGGYSLELDSRWFNDTNPMLANLVYMLPQIWDESNTAIIQQQNLNVGWAINTLPSFSHAESATSFLVSGLNSTVWVNTWPALQNDISNKITFEFNVSVRLTPNQSVPTGATLYHSPYNAIELNVNIVDDSNMYYGGPAFMASRSYLLVMIPDNDAVTMDDVKNNLNGWIGSLEQGRKVIECRYTPGMSSWNLITFTDTLSAINTRSFMDAQILRTSPRMIASVSYLNTNTPWMYKLNGATRYQYNGRGILRVDITDVKATTTHATRTEKALTLGNLFRNEKPFGVLLKYSKLMHLVWQVDDGEKKVTVKRSKDYFADMLDDGITNISKLVDTTKGVEVTPLSWTDNKVQLNFENSEMDYIREYAERWGLTYGSKMIITTNKINPSTKKLLGTGEYDKIVPSALLSESLVPAGQLMNVSSAAYGYVEAPAQPLNEQDGESANNSGCFYFRLPNGTWDTRLAAGWSQDSSGVYALITDDLDFETNMGEWAWHGPMARTDYHQSSWVKCRVRPRFDTTSPDGSTSVHFAAVRELFSDYHNEPVAYLYDGVWKDYIEEVYNEQNKTLTVYANIGKMVYDKLKANPLVQIGNCIYLLMEIKDWTERKQTCKCKLRQIYNLSKLTGQQ